MILIIQGLLYLAVVFFCEMNCQNVLTSDNVVPLPCISSDDDVHLNEFSESPLDTILNDIQCISLVNYFDSALMSNDTILPDTLPDGNTPWLQISSLHLLSSFTPKYRPRHKPGDCKILFPQLFNQKNSKI